MWRLGGDRLDGEVGRRRIRENPTDRGTLQIETAHVALGGLIDDGMLSGGKAVVHGRLAFIDLRLQCRHLRDEVRTELIALAAEEHVDVGVAAAAGSGRTGRDAAFPARVRQYIPTTFPDELFLLRRDLGVPGDAHGVHERRVPNTFLLHLRPDAGPEAGYSRR